VAALSVIALAMDDPQGAHRNIREALEVWPHRSFLVQHAMAMVFDAWAYVYEGEEIRALERVERDWPSLRRSLLLNVQFIRGLAWATRGICSLAAAHAAAPHASRLLRQARRIQRKLEREHMRWIDVYASLIAAGVANIECDRPRTIAALRRAIECAEARDMMSYACAARHRLGLLLQNPEGDEQTRAAEEHFARMGVRSPARLAGCWLPGRWER
jgi:hypothetical protein